MKNVEDIYPLSPLQQGMLFHTLNEPNSGMYIEQYRCILSGELDVEKYKQAWEFIAKRHQALRTAFIWEGMDEPLQIVRRNIELVWKYEDWNNYPSSEFNDQFEFFLKTDRETGFNIGHAPLMRFTLIQKTDKSYQFVWSFHHIITDGWSTLTILKEVLDAYDAFCQDQQPLLLARRPYRDYIAWLQQQNFSKAEIFWKEMLKGFTAPTSLDNVTSRTLENGHGEKEMRLPQKTTDELREFARTNRLTLNTLFQGAWAVLLSRYSGESEVVFGATVSTRPVDLDGVEEMIGLFINTLPIKACIDNETPVLSLLIELQEKQIEMRQFEYSPLVEVKRCSDVPGGQNLFDSIVVFENFPIDKAPVEKLGKLKISDVHYQEQSNYPIAILVFPGTRLKLIINYDRSLFRDDTIKRILGHFQTVLLSFMDNPNQRLYNLKLLTKTERQQLLFEWNQNEKEYPQDLCIHQLIEKQVALNQKKAAIICESLNQEHVMSYIELNQRSNQLAHYLRKVGIGPDELVCILMGRSVEMIVSILGVLKAGGAYVPLDPEYPEERLKYLLEDTKSSVVLTQQRLLKRFQDLEYTKGDGVYHKKDKLDDDTLSSNDKRQSSINNIRVICLDTESSKIDLESNENLIHCASSNNIAYVIYTSGSTGNPKGVMVTHRNLMHSTHARFSYYKNTVQSFLLLSSFAFDSSVAGIFWTLCSGGTLCIPDQERYKDLYYLGDLIQKHEISHILCIPSMYQLLLENKTEKLHTLTNVIVAGETCPIQLVETHLKFLPETEFYNEYGPTEATVWATVFDCRSDYISSSVPIGRAIDNIKIYLLDDLHEPVPIGIAGEVYIGGDGVTLGYINQPKLTNEKFICDPFNNNQKSFLYKTGDLAHYLPDGNIKFLGRMDQQVKIQGYRVEPGEIESALTRHPGVDKAAVIVTENIQDVNKEQHQDMSISLDSQDPKKLVEQLLALKPQIAKRILSEIEKTQGDQVREMLPEKQQQISDFQTVSHKTDNIEGMFTKHHLHSDYEIILKIKNGEFIHPPRKLQREWIIDQACNEFESDITHLDKIAKDFVAGKESKLDVFDVSQADLGDQEIMEDWQTPVMKAMAKNVTENHGDVLEIGFGRGVSSTFIQEHVVKSHTIIEANPKVVERYFNPWKQLFPGADIHLFQERWQDCINRLNTYDGIFFHAFPLNEQEFFEYILKSVTFAEHFFPVAAKLLKSGGVFTYLTTEIDSLSRRHQRSLFQYFSSLVLSVEPLCIPDDTKDFWWANSMVVIKAVK